MNTRITVLLFSTFTLLLGGCAGNPMRQYDGEMKGTVQLAAKGSVKEAVALLEKNNEPGLVTKDKDILYFLEKGELLTLGNDYPGAKDAWLKADEFVRGWEDSVKTDPSKLMGDIGSVLINDKARRYEGQDYEKVMLSANLMLSHIMQGKKDDARIEMKKTVERETLIKNFREKEYDKLQDDAKTQKVAASMKDMKGYPMEDLDAPEVTNLKNGFQNAFAHYLAGYFFDVTGEPSMADPGYKNAAALAPNSALAAAGRQHSRPGAKESDVLFVIESGFAPSWKSITIPIPIPRKNGLIATPLSFPIIKAENKGFVPPSVDVAGKKVKVETLTNLDAMARRQLKDQMPGIILRTAIRAVLKSVAQEQANKANPLLGVATNVAAVVSEQADDRSWRTLPERISVARTVLPQGRQTIEFQTGSGSVRKEIEVAGSYTIIPIRMTGETVLLGKTSIPSEISAMAAESEPVIKPQPAAKPASKAKKTAPPAAKNDTKKVI